MIMARGALLIMLTMAMVQESNARLVNLKEILPEAFFEIRYATPNNFTSSKVYQGDYCFLEEQPAHALRLVQDKLNNLKLRLKIWDGYRPLSVQKIFWNLVPDPRYVANPAKGSKHNRGCAVDLTLTDRDGNNLAMGTDFDDFSQAAHITYNNISPLEKANRLLLQQLMHEEGFSVEPTEWWHFNFKGWENFPVLDIPFEKIEN